MRLMLEITIPMDAGNAAIKNGSLGATLQKILGEIKAESAYFTTMDGRRGGYVVVDVQDASDLPRIAEPFFLALHAEINAKPVMNAQDLAKAMPSIEKAVKAHAAG
jgi:hypothetical protein